jgi:hypothetical protein
MARAFVREEQPDLDRSATYPGRGGPVRWESRSDGSTDGIVSLSDAFGAFDWVVGYAWTTVESDREQAAELRLGCDDQMRVWLEGKLVYEYSGVGPMRLDQGVAPVTLKQGRKPEMHMNEHGITLRHGEHPGRPSAG